MGNRIYNFNPGPAVLPEDVLNEAAAAIPCYKETGVGILETSHRSPAFKEIIETATNDLKALLTLGEDYEVLFLHGGASLQFHMVPLNLARGGKAAYLSTGSWSKKAITEAKRVCEVEVVASSEDKNFNYIPKIDDKDVSPDNAYLHVTSNNTIFGTQFPSEPPSNGLPLVCDASSDFLSRPIDVSRYGIIYAGAQKNLGPAGVAVAVIRKDLLEKSAADLPLMLSYANHAKSGSCFNTPPAFAVYTVGLVLKWIRKRGGLEAMEKHNRDKAALLYDCMDAGDFYRPTAERDSRSLMNVTFRLPSEELEARFVKEAAEKGLGGLKGHRSVGGIRASIYNAFPVEGVRALTEFMKAFETQNG